MAGAKHAKRCALGMACRVLAVASVLGLPAVADAGDIAGSKDHPLVGRFQGASIVAYGAPRFEETGIVLGQVRLKGGRPVPDRSEVIEGKVTRIVYTHPKGKSAYEVYRNFREALREKGFELRFECGGRRNPCVRGFTSPIAQLVQRRVGSLRQLSDTKFLFESLWGRGERFLTARLRREGAPETHVMVYVHDVAGNASPAWGAGRALAYVEVVESGRTPTGQIVTPEQMAQAIARTGRVALYNIYFDHDSARLKPESDAALEAIATLLRRDPDLRLFVVGHTDATGDLRYNLALSRRRAQAVVEALVGRHGIERARLHPEGVGPLAPVAPNTDEAGRAKNRRVELVRQGTG